MDNGSNEAIIRIKIVNLFTNVYQLNQLLEQSSIKLTHDKIVDQDL